MARMARVVVPGVAYHVTHRGNRRQNLFVDEDDRVRYKDWLSEYSDRFGLEIWSYCMMTNHVHLIVRALGPVSLAQAIGRTHGRFAQWQNRRNEWSGHLWANRYHSTALDEEHAWAAVRYVERNPVRAGIVARAELYPWSSARSHATGIEDPLLSPSRPFPGHIRDWSRWLGNDPSPETLDALRKNTTTGRPTGSQAFVKELESKLGRSLEAPKFGRRSKESGACPQFLLY